MSKTKKQVAQEVLADQRAEIAMALFDKAMSLVGPIAQVPPNVGAFNFLYPGAPGVGVGIMLSVTTLRICNPDIEEVVDAKDEPTGDDQPTSP